MAEFKLMPSGEIIASINNKSVKVIGIEVTGVLRSGKRFQTMKYPATKGGWSTAMCINLYCGNRWARLENGKRVKINPD